MGRKSKKKERYHNDKAKEKLILKAMVYFQNNGTKNTMNEMAKNLTISKTTIYNHFKTKEDLIHETVKYKIDIINDYETVLTDTTLSYVERYRKSMLFFCVQVFDVNSTFLTDIEQNYPRSWELIHNFQYRVFINLTKYYQEGINKKIFKESSAALLTMNDQYFFSFLSSQEFLKEHKITVLTAFKQHFQTKFFGILNPNKERAF